MRYSPKEPTVADYYWFKSPALEIEEMVVEVWDAGNGHMCVSWKNYIGGPCNTELKQGYWAGPIPRAEKERH